MEIKQISFCIIVLLQFTLTQSNASSSQKCGRPPPSLSGSGIQSPVDVPWAGHITLREDNGFDRTFPAVLISPSVLLASAHYLQEAGTLRFHIFNISSYYATLGTRYFGDPVHFEDDAVKIGLSSIRIQPGYVPGNWSQALNDHALFHLKEPVTDSYRINHICLPDSSDTATLQEIKSPTTSSSQEDELVLTGWNRVRAENMFLRLKTVPPEVCVKLWADNYETNFKTYPKNKWCAMVGKENNHTLCIHKDVGGVRIVNGSYYFSGIVDDFYSSNGTKRCNPGAEYYFRNIEQHTLEWIETNLKCGSDKFTCDNGECISLSGVCDRNFTCVDKSDEEPKFCRGLNFCKDDEFACGTYGACIPKWQVGDGVVQCENGEDEEASRKLIPILEIVSSLTLIFVGIACIIVLLWRRHVRKLKKEIRNLTRNEVDDFLYGKVKSKLSRRKKIWTTQVSKVNNNDIQSQPWDKRHNIALNHIKIVEELNRGNFGIVYKAELTVATAKQYKLERNVCDVAVKTNLKTVGVEDFKILLSELKMLAHVGEHANIVRFFGACTENIKQREVYLVVEYCPNGSIKDFLEKNAKYFVDSGTLAPANCGQQSQLLSDYLFDNSQYGFLNLYDLILWTTQITSGMEYLAAKNIVHGDLATRNVLLSLQLDAKISDFGLSRKLEYSGVYIKSSDDPIPWKWLAIETLMSNEFSEKTDVWAFGITIWEIFTLGGKPYSATEWNKAFLNDLIAGLRLEQPEYASDEIYGLMTTCWKQYPADRPTFATLRDKFIKILHRRSGYSKRSGASRQSKHAQLGYLQLFEVELYEGR